MKICKVEKKREVVDVDYEICSDNYCCDKMRQWLRIGTRNRKNLRCSIDTNKFEICVKQSCGSSYGYREDDSDKAVYEDLNFCPFCGANVYNAGHSPQYDSSVTCIIGESGKKHWWQK